MFQLHQIPLEVSITLGVKWQKKMWALEYVGVRAMRELISYPYMLESIINIWNQKIQYLYKCVTLNKSKN